MNLAAAIAETQGRAWLEDLDPRVKVGWVLAVSTLSVLLDSTTALVALFVAAAVPFIGIRMPARALGALGGLLLAITWATVLTQALFYAAEPRTALLTIVPPLEFGAWKFPGIRFYEEGAVYGLAQSLRLLALTLAGLTACLSTSPERLLAGLVRLRMPAAIAFMTVATLRFLPMSLAELSTVRQARRLRGYRFRPWSGPAAWLHALRLEVALLLPLLALALRRASALATSISSRGFDPGAPRTFYPELRLRAWERFLVAVLLLLVLAIAVAKAAHWLSAAGWYAPPALEALSRLATRWL